MVSSSTFSVQVLTLPWVGPEDMTTQMLRNHRNDSTRDVALKIALILFQHHFNTKLFIVRPITSQIGAFTMSLITKLPSICIATIRCHLWFTNLRGRCLEPLLLDSACVPSAACESNFSLSYLKCNAYCSFDKHVFFSLDCWFMYDRDVNYKKM
jgi:hypothetical protein